MLAKIKKKLRCHTALQVKFVKDELTHVTPYILHVQTVNKKKWKEKKKCTMNFWNINEITVNNYLYSIFLLNATQEKKNMLICDMRVPVHTEQIKIEEFIERVPYSFFLITSKKKTKFWKRRSKVAWFNYDNSPSTYSSYQRLEFSQVQCPAVMQLL